MWTFECGRIIAFTTSRIELGQLLAEAIGDYVIVALMAQLHSSRSIHRIVLKLITQSKKGSILALTFSCTYALLVHDLTILILCLIEIDCRYRLRINLIGIEIWSNGLIFNIALSKGVKSASQCNLLCSTLLKATCAFICSIIVLKLQLLPVAIRKYPFSMFPADVSFWELQLAWPTLANLDLSGPFAILILLRLALAIMEIQSLLRFIAYA